MPNGTNTYHFDSLLFSPFRQPQYKDDGEKDADGMDGHEELSKLTMRLEWSGEEVEAVARSEQFLNL